MPCTTILVGKKASYDGSTMIARNDDSGSGRFTPKKFAVIGPQQQPKVYESVLSHVKVELPDNPLRYTAVPNAVEGEGIWAASGVNAANVAMTATETITSNPRVLGADPLVVYQPAKDGKPEVPGGIGEEDIVCLVLPYIRSAREGVARLGSLLEQYGTYEMNGIAFQDQDEIWWLETIGGHHWIARKVPDDSYVVMPNQLGIDRFDLEDARTEQRSHMCSADLEEFIEKYHLDLSIEGDLNPRDAFGSHDDADHVYNTPRAWVVERYFNPRTVRWDGPDADYTPVSDDLPWCMVPEKKITVEDVKYVLSSHFQGTPYDPYGAYGDRSMRGAYRSIGINRNDSLELLRARVGCPIHLLPTLPPSIPGIRAQQALQRRFRALGGEYFLGDSVVSAETEGSRVERIFTANHGNIPFEAAHFVLATGSFFSKGLQATPDRIVEPVFGADTEYVDNRAEWYTLRFFDRQAYQAFGVKTDSSLRVLKEGKVLENLYCAGAGLAGFHPVQEGCGAGVSMLSALHVAENISRFEYGATGGGQRRPKA